jgi:hypothetical protein
MLGKGPRRERDDVAEALVIALGVVVLDEFADCSGQMTLAQWDDCAAGIPA